jgi:hypothetical protein
METDMSIEINTNEYQFAHGKKPRGYGYWAFFFDSSHTPVFIADNWGDARKRALAYARAHQHECIRLGS